MGEFATDVAKEFTSWNDAAEKAAKALENIGTLTPAEQAEARNNAAQGLANLPGAGNNLPTFDR